MENRNLASRFILFFSFGLIFSALLSCESRNGSQQKLKTNAPPAIISVALLPEKAYKASELNLVVQSKDPDGDPITCRYQWIKNDQEIAGENQSSLKADRFQKGDLIQVRVIPSDGKAEGPSYLSPSVKILNSPPVIQEVWIDPSWPLLTTI